MLTPQRTSRLAVAGAAALAITATGSVAAEDTARLYAGVGLGVTNFTSDHDGIDYSDRPVGWQIYGGWQTRESTAFELAVEHLAGIQMDDLLGSGVERLRISADHTTFAVRAVYNLSLQEVLRRRKKIAVFGTLGLARLLEERNVVELTTSQSTSVSERATGLVLGAGVTFEIAGIRLRAYLQSIDRADDNLNSLGAAAEFRF